MDQTQLLDRLIQSSPYLAAVVIQGLAFLVFLWKALGVVMATGKGIQEAHLAAHRETSKRLAGVITENTQALRTNASVQGQVLQRLQNGGGVISPPGPG